MRTTAAAIWTAGGLVTLAAMSSLASAQTTAVSQERVASSSASLDVPAPTRKRRGPTRLRVYPNYSYPGPNAVRQCEAHYEQEYRQSGTVIVPRMHCWWQRG
jgi:hypothetical protein